MYLPSYSLMLDYASCHPHIPLSIPTLHIYVRRWTGGLGRTGTKSTFEGERARRTDRQTDGRIDRGQCLYISFRSSETKQAPAHERCVRERVCKRREPRSAPPPPPQSLLSNLPHNLIASNLLSQQGQSCNSSTSFAFFLSCFLSCVLSP